MIDLKTSFERTLLDLALLPSHAPYDPAIARTHLQLMESNKEYRDLSNIFSQTINVLFKDIPAEKNDLTLRNALQLTSNVLFHLPTRRKSIEAANGLFKLYSEHQKKSEPS